jgi:bifunctional enzyme CysN/CysC
MKPEPPVCIWFTGLSGAGKSTLGDLLAARLRATGRATYVLDGDRLRTGLNRDLGFTDADRRENVRRVAEVARLMVEAGVTVIVTLISPFRTDRAAARVLFADGEFIEVHVATPLTECIRRDPKGLYAQALAGALPHFTGISSPYEPPLQAEVVLDTADSPETLIDLLMNRLERPCPSISTSPPKTSCSI